MVVIAIIVVLVALYLWSKQKNTKNIAQAEAMGIDVETVEEAVVPKLENAYAKAARDIGVGALDAARLAKDNAKTVVSEVQREQKLNKLQMLLEDEELLTALKSRVKE